ncbi:hypothetical protein F9K87_23040, partial [Brucella anthropi]
LESRAVVPARSSRHGISCSWHLSRTQAEIPLIRAVQISRATSFRTVIGDNHSGLAASFDQCRQFPCDTASGD